LEAIVMNEEAVQNDHPSEPRSDTHERQTPVYNERGVIAEHYRDLQGLPALDAARQAYPLPSASTASTMRAVFQAAEIAILNLADLISRAAADVAEGRTGRAMVKMSWARGFHRVLVRLSTMPQQLGLVPGDVATSGFLCVADSPAFAEYLRVLEHFDRATLAAIDGGALALDTALADESLDSALFALIHAARVSNHESTIWEENLGTVAVGAPVPSYEQFVAAAGIRAAVYDRVLRGDTYFTQFRGLHQIPETLGEEANDRTEHAIREIRAGNLRVAVDHLRAVNVLAEGMLATLPPMADNLATSDYHEIRENLGLTSGSHSVCLRFHMFTDLYHQLAAALDGALDGSDSRSRDRASLVDTVRRVDETSVDDSNAWLCRLLLSECLTFRSLIMQWRDQHLHMPRNNLGGGSTKSLTGSTDAVAAVRKMRRSARLSDPMIPLAKGRGLSAPTVDDTVSPLRAYLDSEASLDTRTLLATGRVTQGRFIEVQERLGFFAHRCPFTPPRPRRV
jgi:tryptophan 2,3-dioxygenase